MLSASGLWGGRISQVGQTERHRQLYAGGNSGVATNTVGIAATGNASTLTVAIEQHP